MNINHDDDNNNDNTHNICIDNTHSNNHISNSSPFTLTPVTPVTEGEGHFDHHPGLISLSITISRGNNDHHQGQ